MKRFVGHVVAAAAVVFFVGCGGMPQEPNLPGDHSGMQAISTSESEVIWSAADQQCTFRGSTLKSFEGMSIDEGCFRLKRAAGDGTIMSVENQDPGGGGGGGGQVCCYMECTVTPEWETCSGPICFAC